MHTITFDAQAGIKVRHTTTGLTGIITSRLERINGCLQYHIQPPYKEDGTAVDGLWTDFEDLEPVEGEFESEDVELQFRVGDKVRNRVVDKVGIITVAKVDKNGCIGYWLENGEKGKDGGCFTHYGFEQEFDLVGEGFNKTEPGEKPYMKKKTGCVQTPYPPK